MAIGLTKTIISVLQELLNECEVWEPFSKLSVPAHGLRLLLALDIYRVDPQGPAEVDSHDKEDNAAIKLSREGTPPRGSS